MFIILYMMLIIILIMTFMMLVNIFLYKKNMFNKEKTYPLECGFNMINTNTYLPFSIQFYYISILFLIFDMEISLMLPMIQSINFNLINNWILTFTIITIILLIGLYLEWWNNLIKWY